MRSLAWHVGTRWRRVQKLWWVSKGQGGSDVNLFLWIQGYIIYSLTKPCMDIFNNRKQQLLQTYIFFKDRVFQKVVYPGNHVLEPSFWLRRNILSTEWPTSPFPRPVGSGGSLCHACPTRRFPLEGLCSLWNSQGGETLAALFCENGLLSLILLKRESESFGLHSIKNTTMFWSQCSLIFRHLRCGRVMLFFLPYFRYRQRTN